MKTVKLQLNLFGGTNTVQPSTSSANTSNTPRINIQLDSSLQGYLRAATKLTRNLEKANHHTQLLHTAIIQTNHPEDSSPQDYP